jgi:hypothetical protein
MAIGSWQLAVGNLQLAIGSWQKKLYFRKKALNSDVISKFKAFLVSFK